MVDHPNARSLHRTPTPRLGGLGVMAGALPIAAWLAGERYGLALACALALGLLSAVDDWRSLPVGVRLPAHRRRGDHRGSCDAGSRPRNGSGPRRRDRVDDQPVQLHGRRRCARRDRWRSSVSAPWRSPRSRRATRHSPSPARRSPRPAPGFLVFNFPPARVFLGDAGSVPLGFLAGALGAQGALSGAWPMWFPVLVFSPFIVDATVTIARRVARGERIWIAHRDHYYQRLVLSGWTRAAASRSPSRCSCLRRQ